MGPTKVSTRSNSQASNDNGEPTIEMTRTFCTLDIHPRFADAMAELVYFGKDKRLLRGVFLSEILKSCGRIFASSTGSRQTYSLSFVAEHLDAFISHNWSVGRFKKFLTLCIHFNFDVSVAVSLVVVVAISLATRSGVLPRNSRICTILFFPVFCVSMMYIRTLSSFVGHPGPVVFLDKVCICQDDAQLQRRGILKLGAFIAKSDKMLILYTDIYLQKLWTVYEVATFLSVRDVDKMEVVSVSYCTLLFYVYISMHLSFYGEKIEQLFHIECLHYEHVCPLAWTIISIMLRRRSREKKQIKSRLSTFNVQECMCAVESDRPVVYHNISELMLATKNVDEDATLDEALAAFDSLVRRKLPDVFLVAGDNNSRRYKHAVTMGILVSIPRILDELDHNDTRDLSIRFFHMIHVCFVAFPIMFRILEFMNSRSLPLTEGVFLDTAWAVFCWPFIVVPFLYLDITVDAYFLQTDSMVVWVVMMFAHIVGVYVTYIAYRYWEIHRPE
eukprot:TRINITY_DN4748_c0_g2_i1.p1 TRINITY_DN4748_c0_g2~~TRINITY_DN4748_c0_g2_i1.p1  ORF type:complete len:501 (+),score=47.55 TRINITY_DN4748_c0_g2_i1:192-1694(+)